ncbi:MAG: hypothetical protein MJ158_02600 [Alphaproteobacteria bacterium]|nr:hypothetical protein [Alphaproteobacteria bacterium]
MTDLKNTLFEYLAHRHIDLMPADVAERFEDYNNNSTFNGHMRTWSTRYYGQPIVSLTTTITNNDDWKKIYKACQFAFQTMYENKNHSVGIGSDYNPATKDFIDRWFGTNPNKTFTMSKATQDTEDTFTALENFLTTNSIALKPIFIKNIPQVFGETTYEKFVQDLRGKKYNTEPKFRSKVQSVIEYIQYAAPKEGNTEEPDGKDWPRRVGYTMTTGTPPVITHTHGGVLEYILGAPYAIPPLNPKIESNPDDWYEIQDLDLHVNNFKTDYAQLFDELLINSTFRTKFLEYAKSPIKEALETAIKDTDYENKESDDYVPAKLTDSKNWQQRLKKWSDDTYENHFRRFVEFGRGTRLFFSAHTQNIMKSFDKVGIKPTDGLEGILAKKDDAKLRNVINTDPTTRKHFDWFVKKMEELKQETPDDFEGALRDGTHLRNLVINLIIKTSKECESDKGAKDKAMTALEVLSVAKYGLLSSRTLNNLKETTKDLNMLSDDKLSWNKNEGLQFVTKAMDATARFAINGIGTIATGIRNFVSHRRTKLGKYIGKYSQLNDAYKKWQEEDNERHNNLIDSNVAHDVMSILADLDNPARPITGRYKTNIQINADTIDGIKTALETARATLGATTVTIAGHTYNIEDLENDVSLFEDASDRNSHEEKWREEHPDVMHDLVAHWDMLESTLKTHAFSLGSMKLKRKNMLLNAKARIAANISNYGDLRTK